jgi:hypothetical protein
VLSLHVCMQTLKDMDAIQSIFTTGAYKQVHEKVMNIQTANGMQCLCAVSKAYGATSSLWHFPMLKICVWLPAGLACSKQCVVLNTRIWQRTSTSQ